MKMNKQNILFHKTVAYWGRPILYSIQPWHIGEDYFLEHMALDGGCAYHAENCLASGKVDLKYDKSAGQIIAQTVKDNVLLQSKA